MTHEESWNTFIDELRAYVLEHHHFPNKHTNLLSRVKYTRKKINEGSLEEWMPKTDDIHPPKTGISVHFSDFFHPNGDAKLLIFSDSGHFSAAVRQNAAMEAGRAGADGIDNVNANANVNDNKNNGKR